MEYLVIHLHLTSVTILPFFANLVTRIFVKMSQNSGKEIPLTELNVGQLNHLSQQLDQVYMQDDFIA